VTLENEHHEYEKSQKILLEIDKILKMKRLLSESEPTPYVPSQKTLRGSTIKHKPEWDNKKSKPLH
jgi:hypothetical protein